MTSLDQTENEIEFVTRGNDDQKYRNVKSGELADSIRYGDFKLLEEINRLWIEGKEVEAINLLEKLINENPDYSKEKIAEILNDDLYFIFFVKTR